MAPTSRADSVPGDTARDVVEDLVDETHRVDVARANRRAGIRGQVALRVHLLREAARGGEVGEDDVAGQAEERVVELVTVARRARDVELEGCHSRLNVINRRPC